MHQVVLTVKVLPNDLIAKLVGLRLKELSEKYPDLDFKLY